MASMLTVKLKGVGEGIFAELAEDMMRGGGWLSWFWFVPCFYVLSCSSHVLSGIFLLIHQCALGQWVPMCHLLLSNLSSG